MLVLKARWSDIQSFVQLLSSKCVPEILKLQIRELSLYGCTYLHTYITALKIVVLILVMVGQ